MYQTGAGADTATHSSTKSGQRMRSQVPRLVAWIFCSAIGAAFADEPLAARRLPPGERAGRRQRRCPLRPLPRSGESRRPRTGKELQLHVARHPGAAAEARRRSAVHLERRSRTGRQRFLPERRARVRAHPARPRPGAGRSARHGALEPAGLRAAGRFRVRRARSAKAAGSGARVPGGAARRSALLHDQHRCPRSRRRARRARLSAR